MTGKRQKPNRKKPKRRQAHRRTEATRVPAPQWYHLPLRLAEERADNRLRVALLEEPIANRRDFFAAFNGIEHLDQSTAWEALRQYLGTLEERIATIVRKHSVFYWIHLYRRIGVALHPSQAGADDPMTKGWVRQIVETAFSKYGNLEIIDDIGLTNEMPTLAIWGGLLAEAFALNRLDGAAEFGALRTRPQFAPRHFTVDDLVDVYRAEGLAHEYWLTMARMRGVGKGEMMDVRDGEVLMSRLPALDQLIDSYDGRIARNEFESAKIGSAFFQSYDAKLRSLVMNYNVSNLPFPDFGEGFIPIGGSPNFYAGMMDIDAYLAAHGYLEMAFAEKHGFHLRSLCAVLSALPFHCIYRRGDGSDGKDDIPAAMHQLYQRAYFTEPSIRLDDLIGLSRAMVEPPHRDAISQEAQKIVEFLTLDQSTRDNIRLSSVGPRFPFVRYGSPAVVIDLLPTAQILNTVVVGLPADHQAKGPLFEDTFRAQAEKLGLEVLPQRELRANGRARELDAGIRKGGTLYLCECRALAKPFDFDLGRPQSINSRNDTWDQKVTQALSLGDFIRTHPAGTNYDFSWATEIVPLVVSPFCEWIWTLSNRLWLDATTPRILSASEALMFIQRETIDAASGTAGADEISERGS